MIKASELRIGNYIEVVNKIGGNFVSKVKEVNSEGVTLDEAPSGYYIENSEVNPIPLTEEWLERFGFIKKGFTFSKDNIEVWNAESEWNYKMKQKGYYGKEVYIKVEFVHQLQNLHFALTGEELIKK